MSLGVRAKSLINLAVVMLLVVMIMAIFLVKHQHDLIQNWTYQRATLIARWLAYSTWYGVFTTSVKESKAVAREVMDHADMVYLVIYEVRDDANATILNSYHVDSVPGIPELRRTTDIEIQQITHASEGIILDVVVPIQNRQDPISTLESSFFHDDQAPESKKIIGYCQFGVPLEQFSRNLLATQTSIGLIVAVGVVLIGAYTIFVVNRYLLRPITELTAAARRVAKGDLAVHIDTELIRGKEIDPLIQDFNMMVSSLRTSREALRAQLAEINRLNKLKSEFLANVSHELRTPLNSILGYSQLLQEGMVGELSPYQQDSVDRIHKNATHLFNLISEILDLSKIESGKVVSEISSFELQECLIPVIESFTLAVQEKQLQLLPDLPPETVRLRTDGVKLKQILYNLLSNAIKFTNVGRITVTARVFALDLELTVADTGIGIPASQLGTIFDEFVQLRSPENLENSGHGLGLSVSQKLAAVLGGTITVTSTPGEGSLFTVILPGVVDQAAS